MYLFFFCVQAKADSDAEVEEENSDDDLPLEIGDSLPSLVLKNEKGEDIQVADLAAENGVVLFLVPKADTRT
jgi:peroxiredoxin Q/BCP